MKKKLFWITKRNKKKKISSLLTYVAKTGPSGSWM